MTSAQNERVIERHVVCATDSHMVYALCVAIDSLQHTASSPFRLTIGYLDGALPESERNYLSAVMSHIGIAHEFANLGTDARFITQGHISPTTFAKFLLADAQQRAHLWIDADTVGLPGWDDLFTHIAQASAEQGLVVAKRGGDTPSASFNAGVLGWPAGTRREWSNHLDSLGLVDTQEQYLFNMLYAPTALRVSERFNVLTYRVDTLSSGNPPFIIHYAGAHKPWHLPRRLAHLCREHRCPWSEWFIAESRFLEGLTGSPLREATLGRMKNARRSGTLRWQRDHMGLFFLRLLQLLGPLGGPFVGVLRPMSQLVPRGTHPVHKRVE